jgi:CRISPR-associated protein Cas2
MAGPQWNLIAYDVRDSGRLRKTAKMLEGYGERVQFSIFRVRVTKEKLAKLRWELSQILTEDDDLLVIPLCERCSGKIDELSQGDHSDWGEPPATFEVL